MQARGTFEAPAPPALVAAVGLVLIGALRLGGAHRDRSNVLRRVGRGALGAGDPGTFRAGPTPPGCEGARPGALQAAAVRAGGKAHRERDPILRCVLRIRWRRRRQPLSRCRYGLGGAVPPSGLQQLPLRHRNTVHGGHHRCHLRDHRADQNGRVLVLLLARVLGIVLLLSRVHYRRAGGPAPTVCLSGVLHAFALVLAVEHRQGGVDDVRPGGCRVWRREDLGARRVARARGMRPGLVARGHDSSACGGSHRGVARSRGHHGKKQERTRGSSLPSSREDRSSPSSSSRPCWSCGPTVSCRRAGSTPAG